jgi:hypothetical protein
MSRAARLLAVAALAVSVSQPLAAAPDAAQLIAGLAREAPASIAFAEVRFSSLLREPLIVSGNLAYGGPGNLERQVTHPYRETTTVRGESARIEREGEDPRTLALKNAPELNGLECIRRFARRRRSGPREELRRRRQRRRFALATRAHADGLAHAPACAGDPGQRP